MQKRGKQTKAKKKQHPPYRKETRIAPSTAVTPAMPPTRIDGAAAPVAAAGAVLLEAVAARAVPFSCSARLWKALKFRGDDSSELTAKTMPAPQWLVGDC